MFAINAHLLPAVYSYADAERVFNNAPVINKDYPSVRGLKDKRDDAKTIRKEDDRYIFRYHRTDLVTWRSPTEFTIDPHSSRSSIAFINRFVPVYFQFVRGHACIDGQAVDEASDNLCLLADGNNWAVSPGQLLTARQAVLCRKTAANVRRKFADVLDHIEARRKLIGRQTYCSVTKHVLAHNLSSYPVEALAEGTVLARIADSTGAPREYLSDALLAVSGAFKFHRLSPGTVPSDRHAWVPYFLLVEPDNV